ncbi:1-deoxy-D-xylulose-5-phosphate reductoisomerase [Nesterenkonia ebinurensis]|uniref:1-deoxy-D-xylulose-5-phosphate reductoisomerase n=1 Tax=Nesterenkonia ebinurensis TaxID=2608252 RepID=UPI00123D4951|nr:1-deoxy-D-xylulose-5-phosphate reductoisomerase [Nesterenkonia ebinurensis]
MSEPRRVAILGSTGSIGTQALEVIAANPETFCVVALCAGANAALLAEQVAQFQPELVGIRDDDAAPLLRQRLGDIGQLGSTGSQTQGEPEILTGPEAAEYIAEHSGADVVLNAVTGSIGLKPTLAALRSGATLALANKESLVVGGTLVQQAVQRPGQVVPVDSEHSALSQALASGRHQKGLCAHPETGNTGLTSESEVAKLILTASGGPFRGWSAEQLADVTPAQALAHPTWNMGRVVTTNSATMVNKALEVIEAHLLFDVPLSSIDVVVHPQSVVHSMVQYVDGSTIAQASPPDMRLPIALALGFPNRVPGAAAACDFSSAASWEFEPLDHSAFPAVQLAKQAATSSATHMAVYNAANEQAVAAFHTGRLPFTGILATVEQVLAQHTDVPQDRADLDAVLSAEDWARRTADELIGAPSPAAQGAVR